MSQAVHCGRIDPIDPRIERRVDREDALGILLLAPGKGPTVASDGPGPYVKAS